MQNTSEYSKLIKTSECSQTKKCVYPQRTNTLDFLLITTITEHTTIPIPYIVFVRWTGSSYPSNGRTVHSRTWNLGCQPRSSSGGCSSGIFSCSLIFYMAQHYRLKLQAKESLCRMSWTFHRTSSSPFVEGNQPLQATYWKSNVHLVIIYGHSRRMGNPSYGAFLRNTWCSI